MHRSERRSPALIACSVFLASCASVQPGGPLVATDTEWSALALPRPAPLPGAARVALEEVQLSAQPDWDVAAPVRVELAVTELAIAGMLGRRDVHLVERRRFGVAARAERAGEPRPPGAPRAGVSPGAEYLVTAVWIRLDRGPGAVEIRLVGAGSGAVSGAARVPVADAADPVSIARAVVGATLAALDGLGRRPAWEDPREVPDGTRTGSGVPRAALESFLRGLAAEEEWSWEAARRGYQRAAEATEFPEAMAALARTARLRNGGTLGES